jgi:hypothetical protein
MLPPPIKPVQTLRRIRFKDRLFIAAPLLRCPQETFANITEKDEKSYIFIAKQALRSLAEN